MLLPCLLTYIVPDHSFAIILRLESFYIMCFSSPVAFKIGFEYFNYNENFVILCFL